MSRKVTNSLDDEILGMRILVVDDEPVNVALLQGVLEDEGFTQVRATLDSRQALATIADFRPDVLLLDLMMPWMDGYSVLEQLRVLLPAGEFFPVMVLTADITETAKRRALSLGANDFLTKPFDRTECVLRISNLLTTRRLHRQIASYNVLLEERVRERTAALESALTELRAMQQQLVQRERLSALGAMVTGIAHDFNNSLALILGYGERLQQECRSLDIPGSINDYAQTIVTAALDSAEAVSRLRGFHREAEPGVLRQPVRLDDVARQAIAFTRPRWESESRGRGAPIECAGDFGPTDPIGGSPSELREMLTNLIFNAIDAMPQGGSILLRTRTEGDRVTLEVRDTGIGMTEDVRRRCLEPFFTTKGDRGSGLGLAMVYGTIQRHEGTIRIDSIPGRGTSFIFTFPKILAPEPVPVPEPPVAARVLRILVVDDQPVLAEIIAEMLSRDWHRVATAGDGREALEKFDREDFDVVITDKAMPEVNGDQLAAAIKGRSPKTPVIMLTGFSDINVGDDGVSEFIDISLTKPATNAELRTAVAKASQLLGK
jgi:CheY-like chemotaxis protein